MEGERSFESSPSAECLKSMSSAPTWSATFLPRPVNQMEGASPQLRPAQHLPLAFPDTLARYPKTASLQQPFLRRQIVKATGTRGPGEKDRRKNVTGGKMENTEGKGQ